MCLVCHVFGYVMLLGMSCIMVCHVFGYVMYLGMSCIRVCHEMFQQSGIFYCSIYL